MGHFGVLLVRHQCGLTSVGVTVSELQAQRKQGWDQAGRPDWERWWLSGLAEVNPELTGRERRKLSGVLLQQVHTKYM